MSALQARLFNIAVLVTLVAGLPLRAQTPVGTAFTYQGDLKNGGAPANGIYDLRFRLYTVPTDGVHVAQNCIDDVSVTDGVFTVSLDFGPQFSGDQRFLEVGVRTLNRDFRYQLTVVDEADSAAFVMAKVVSKVRGNRFTIRTSAPAVEVSWQVTGIRQDAWANAHRIPVEVDKPDHERGFFRHPELYGLPPSRKIEEASHPSTQPPG
jgi:hypothetical protein